MQYFSDRELGEAPRTISKISPAVWSGIAWLIQTRIKDGSFRRTSQEKSWECTQRFEATIKAEIPAVAATLYRDRISALECPAFTVIMDIIEFCWREVGKFEQVDHYPYSGLGHEDFDKQAGQNDFRESVNQIFARNGIAFHLTEQGRIERLIAEPIGGLLSGANFRTGDEHLDQLLEAARRKMIVPDLNEHRDALEKLWDAWERMKTITHPKKPVGVTEMLDVLAGADQPKLRGFLEQEAKALTDAGNGLRIRHAETNQEIIKEAAQIDYMFYRMFALIHLVLTENDQFASNNDG